MGEFSKDKILLVHLGGLGDLLLATPAFRALRVAFPEANVTLLACEGSVGLVESLLYFDRIVTLPSRAPEYRGMRFLWHRQPWRSLPELASLRRERFHLAVNFCEMATAIGGLKMALFFGILGAKESAGRDTAGRGFFYTVRSYEPFVGEFHNVEYMVHLVEKVGARRTEDPPRLELPISKEAHAAVEALLWEHGVTEKETLICVAPGGCWPDRRWRLENFEKALKTIVEKVGCRIACLGGAQEVPLARRLKDVFGERCLIACGRLSPLGSAALLRRSRLLLSNDTASVHMASAVGTPVVEVVGSQDLKRLSPYMPKDRYFLFQRPIGCVPCEKTRCWQSSLDRISPGEVAEACLVLLGRSGT